MIGPFDYPEFDSALLSSELLYAVTPLGHPLLSKSSLSPADLKDQPMILGDERELAEFRWRLTDMFNAEGIPLRPTLEASNNLALIGLVAAGLGITIYPESLIGYLGKSVAVRPIIHPSFRSRTILAWRKHHRSVLVKHFISAAKTGALST